MSDHVAGDDQEADEGPLEAAFREDMTDALASIPRIAEAFERGETVSIQPTVDETAKLNVQVLWMMQKHVARLAAEVDRLVAKLD